MMERLRDAEGRYAPDPKTLNAALDAPTLGLLRYLDRWARIRQREARIRARAAASPVIHRRAYTWTRGGRFRRQVATAHQARDADGRFVGRTRWQHGTTASYLNRCRCPDCSGAWRAHMRSYMRWYRKDQPR